MKNAPKTLLVEVPHIVAKVETIHARLLRATATLDGLQREHENLHEEYRTARQREAEERGFRKRANEPGDEENRWKEIAENIFGKMRENREQSKAADKVRGDKIPLEDLKANSQEWGRDHYKPTPVETATYTDRATFNRLQTEHIARKVAEIRAVPRASLSGDEASRDLEKLVDGWAAQGKRTIKELVPQLFSPNRKKPGWRFELPTVVRQNVVGFGDIQQPPHPFYFLALNDRGLLIDLLKNGAKEHARDHDLIEPEDRKERLRKLRSELLALEREEEALILAAFAQHGIDLPRRQQARLEIVFGFEVPKGKKVTTLAPW